MRGAYQLSFDAEFDEAVNEPGIRTLLRDLCPYYQLHSITTALLILHALQILSSLQYCTLLPSNAFQGSTNIFGILLSLMLHSIFLARIGSEFEKKLGHSYFLSIVAFLQILRIVLILGMGQRHLGFLITGNTSLLSLFILSMINIPQWKQATIPEFQNTVEKNVENFDLLDLNDTVIKLRSSENPWTYESFTNKEFYLHNIHKEDRSRPANKNNKRPKKGVRLAQSVSEQQDIGLSKIFKLVLFNFIVRSNHSGFEFIIFLLSQGGLFLLFWSGLLRKMKLY